MWDDKLRHLAQEGFRRRPQSPLRGTRARGRRNAPPEEPDVEPAPYEGVGLEIAAARQNRGWTLDQVAEVLHVQPRYLRAFEEGRIDDLPGPTYATGFLRAYSRHLGLPPEEIVQQFRQESNISHGPTKLVAADAAALPRRPRLPVILLSLLAAAALYAGWNLLAGGGGSTETAIEPAPDRLTMLLKGEAPSPPAVAAAASVEPVPRRLIDAAAAVGAASNDETRGSTSAVSSNGAAVAAREAQRDANATVATLTPPAATAPPVSMPRTPIDAAVEGEDTPPDVPTLETVAVPETAPPSPPPPRPAPRGDGAALPPLPPGADGASHVPRRYGSADGANRVVVRAKVDSWVQVRAGRNETLLTRILRPGDAFYVPNRANLLLTTGNVGGLEIIVDGEPLGPLGPVGAVRRNISLDAEELLAMAAAAGRSEGAGR